MVPGSIYSGISGIGLTQGLDGLSVGKEQPGPGDWWDGFIVEIIGSTGKPDGIFSGIGSDETVNDQSGVSRIKLHIHFFGAGSSRKTQEPEKKEVSAIHC